MIKLTMIFLQIFKQYFGALYFFSLKILHGKRRTLNFIAPRLKSATKVIRYLQFGNVHVKFYVSPNYPMQRIGRSNNKILQNTLHIISINK